MNTNTKNRVKSRSGLGSHQNSSLQNNSKSQMRQKERPMTPEGVYFNARLMHCTTSLVGCVVQIQIKDGTRYEGILRTFSPEFELVVDFVTKIEANSVAIGGSNIANLVASLEAKNGCSTRVIFKFQDVVKLNAINVDLDFATNKGGHVLTDSEISRHDSKQSRDKDVKELVPWDGGAGDLEDALDDCNGMGAPNGWSPEDMFNMNEARFQVKSTYDPTLPDYTCALNPGVGADYEEKAKVASEIASQIENDPTKMERYARENDADDEDKYSAVVRPNDAPHPRNQDRDRNRNRKPNNSPNSAAYSINNNSGGSSAPGLPQRQPRSGMSNTGSAPTSFHSNKNTNYNKQFSGGNGGSYSNSHKSQSYRDEQMSSFPNSGQTYSKAGADNEEPSYANSGPQRRSDDNRRPTATNKRPTDVTADLKKFSNDFKLPNADTSKEKETTLKAESHPKHPNASGFSAKVKSSPGGGGANDNIPVKDKSIESVGSSPLEDSPTEKDTSREVRDSSEPKDTSSDTLEPSSSPLSPTQEPEMAPKKSTLNPNAKTFTPRSPMAPLSTSATPPSVSSTPSSTVSVPISGPMTHAGPHSLSQGHSQQTPVGPQSGGQHQQPRFPNPLVQIPQHYNVLTPGGLAPLLAHNQYLTMTNVSMAPTFQTNPNQQRNYRNKGPQNYQNVRHEFQQQSAHVAAAVTGHPVLAAAPIGAPQQVSYGPQQTTMVQQHPQQMYHYMNQFQPRMNVLPQHTAAMQMGVPQAVQYDPTQLQHIYSAVQLQHLVSQAHQHMTNSGPHSGHSTPQSATPTTPMHGGPAPSPVHHQPNQPPTPTPQQSVMYANVTTAHNPQNPNHHQSGGGPYHNIVILPTGQMAQGHHSGGHGAQIHAHHLSQQTNANHSGGQALLPVHLATFNTNSGV